MDKLVSFQYIVPVKRLSTTFVYTLELWASVGEFMSSQMVFALKLVRTVLASEKVAGRSIHCEMSSWLSLVEDEHFEKL